MGLRGKTDYFWQSKLDGRRHYVDGLDWLIERADTIRLLELYNIGSVKKGAKLTAYLEEGILYTARFNDYEEAQRFVIRYDFRYANKEIHSV